MGEKVQGTGTVSDKARGNKRPEQETNMCKYFPISRYMSGSSDGSLVEGRSMDCVQVILDSQTVVSMASPPQTEWTNLSKFFLAI